MNDFVQFFSDSDPSNVSTSIKLMLLLTVLSLAPSYSNFNDFFCTNHHRSVICQNSTCNTANATKPSACWSSTVFNIFHHGTDVSTSE